MYDKPDDFDFKIVNFPFLDGDVPRSTSYGVYISQLIRFARASNYTRQKKKRTTTIFPLRSPFDTKMLNIMKYSFLIKYY